jgi:hypothetical protein
MTAKAKRNPTDRQPVGWYHSHTRSEIFLSETDQDIHQRFFPEPWQVALVLKPHTFEPTRGGFFFREADGSIRGAASYREFILDPLPMRPVPAPDASARRPPHQEAAMRRPPLIARFPESPAAPSAGNPTAVAPIHREIPVKAPPADLARDRESAAEPVALDPPRFTQLRPDRSRLSVKLLASLGVIVALCGSDP